MIHWIIHFLNINPCHLRIVRQSSHFCWIRSPTTISVNFRLGSFFLVTTGAYYFSFCCLKQWLLKPVSKVWPLRNLSTFKIFHFFFGKSAAVFSCLFVFFVKGDPHKPRFHTKTSTPFSIRNFPIPPCREVSLFFCCIGNMRNLFDLKKLGVQGDPG